jgi:hypothetical protein
MRRGRLHLPTSNTAVTLRCHSSKAELEEIFFWNWRGLSCVVLDLKFMGIATSGHFGEYSKSNPGAKCHPVFSYQN